MYRPIYVLTPPPVVLTLKWSALSEVFVRTFFTAVLLAALTVLLIQAPALAAPGSSPSVPLGVVVSAENSNYGAAVTTSGSTVYDGDRLKTLPNATLRVPLGR